MSAGKVEALKYIVLSSFKGVQLTLADLLMSRGNTGLSTTVEETI